MKEMIHHIGVIILAAGRSARMGSPKQLLVHEGKTLLHRSVDTVLSAGFTETIVVLGAVQEELRKELNDFPVKIAINDGWEEGMGSSIRTGLKSLKEHYPETDGALIMVCDQPHVDSVLLNGLIAQQRESGLPIVASRYGDTTGTPAVFHRSVFPLLLELKGDRGAGKLIATMPEMVGVIEFPEGANDIDTMEDYDRLKNG